MRGFEIERKLQVDQREILAAAPAAEWHVVELDRCATDMLTAVQMSIGWLTARGLATAVSAR